MPKLRPPLPPRGGDARPDGLPNLAAFVAAARDEIRTTTDVDQIVEALVAVWTLEVEAEAQLLRLSTANPKNDDATLDTRLSTRP